MDDSQGSDILSQSVDVFCDSPTNMDQDTYGNFITNTKLALSKNCDIHNTSFSEYFASLLNDCYVSISKSLDLIIELCTESDVPLNKLMDYLNNTIDILKMLSNYIKNLVESVVFTCRNSKMLPGTMGRILIIIFTHCKDSEPIYGSYLGTVEKQLKELFRMCHELQLTYLLILEKHFLFDFDEIEDHNILVQALEINLRIGEIVHKLDVKTMAEQWKAFTTICEKYTAHIINKDIIHNCTKILCEMIINNIKNVEINQDEKVLLRSCKVTCFTIKILIKLCTVFKTSTLIKYDHILELLIFTFLNSDPYMEMLGKSSQFICLMNTNIIGPMEYLIKELLLEERFLHCVTTYDVRLSKNKDDLLGFILLIATTMKIQTQMGSRERTSNNMKTELVQCVYGILPYCYTWYNIGLKFNIEPLSVQHRTIGLNEYLLTHTVSLVATMNSEEYNVVEQCMTNALLSTDFIPAMFSANLWMLLSRFSSKKLILTQVQNLCKFYSLLKSHVLFDNSPQVVYLSYTIAKLFQVLNYEERARMYETHPLDENLSIWGMLELKYLPEEMQNDIESIILDELKLKLSNVSRNDGDFCKDVHNITSLMNIASTLSINYNLLVGDVVCTWSKLCPEDNFILVQHFENGTLWCIKFMAALTSLTCSMASVLCSKHEDLIKVFHVISKLVQIDCLEIKLLLMDILCKFCSRNIYDENDIIECFLVPSFRNIIQSDDPIIKNKLLLMLYENIDQFNFNKIICKAIKDKFELKQTWLELKKCRILRKHYLEEKKILELSNFEFTHKCIKGVVEISQSNNEIEISQSNNEIEISQSNNEIEISQSGSNFDLVDIDTLFNNESDTEPQCKKIKLNRNETDDIIATLESNILTLYKTKENITSEHKSKIKQLYSHLQNIVD
ncbi:hypothetical protein K1T71_010208 [Dendrolimus kikuchii]|uniref:Uncharacterized protein n=1 Tax=Dendrolimus kikuchii TaxID=765133 RepID=A0ACC1CR47_9NEOP|nr:hypothetical protein K1T71_010208 [Dendrolimus kikuchii]